MLVLWCNILNIKTRFGQESISHGSSLIGLPTVLETPKWDFKLVMLRWNTPMYPMKDETHGKHTKQGNVTLPREALS